MPTCQTCFRRCEIAEGALGFCGARTCRDGQITAANYGRVTSLALDPIEKKPLRRFRPGSLILSAGSYGCNLRCPFCQNHEISWGCSVPVDYDYLSPADLAETAAYYRRRGNIGVAFTYNEPLIGWEYVRDTAKIVRQMGMVNVLVTNGTADLGVLAELTPYIDAMNIDLKGFTDRYYRDVLKGDRQMVMSFIEEAARHCHIELTCLIIPGENDSDEEMEALSKWVASLDHVYQGTASDSLNHVYPDTSAAAPGELSGAASGRDIPLHISRFFPRFHMTDRGPTPVKKIRHLADIARRNLTYVYTGNC